MNDIDQLLKEIDESTIRTNNRLKSMVIRNDVDGLCLSSNNINKPLNINMLVNNDELQILYTKIKAGTTCCEHYHKSSWQYIYVVSGVLKVCDNIYNKGEFVTVPNNIRHSPSAPEGDCVLIIILMPAEQAYKVN